MNDSIASSFLKVAAAMPIAQRWEPVPCNDRAQATSVRFGAQHVPAFGGHVIGVCRLQLMSQLLNNQVTSWILSSYRHQLTSACPKSATLPVIICSYREGSMACSWLALVVIPPLAHGLDSSSFAAHFPLQARWDSELASSCNIPFPRVSAYSFNLQTQCCFCSQLLRCL